MMSALIILVLIFITSLSSACGKIESVFLTQYPHNWINQSSSLIAHACGAVDGIVGTNVREAIIENYNAGHRVFEIDLNLTTDGRLAAVHDWPSYKGPLSSEEFSKIKIADRYSSMTFDDVCRLMTQYPDIYVVTDTKSFEYADVQVTEQFEELYRACAEYDAALMDRIVPQIYNQEMYGIIMDVYPFKSIVYTLYESPDTDDEVVEFIKDKNEIKAITMSPVRVSGGFARKLREHGKVIYCFTLNDIDEMKTLKSKGVTGFYTDFIAPSEGLFSGDR